MLTKNLKRIGRYQLLEVIGKGANGIVYKGLNNETGKSVAIKQVSLSQQQLKSVQSEIYLLRELSHQHIVKYIDVLQNQDNCLHIVLEFIEGGSLANLVKKYPLPENLVKVYIKQVLCGLDYLHQMGVVHRDIKGANILLTKDGIVKLADFGVAIRLNEDHKSFSMAGTPYWMAPEIIQSKSEISTSCDIWSLGCTVIELLTGNPPYFDLMQYPALFRIVQDEHPPLPEVPEDCRDFLLRCFKKQPEERETAGQLIRHRWLEDVNQSKITQIPAYISIEIREFLAKHNYEELIKAIGRIPTKRLIYHNPQFVLIVDDRQNALRAEFVLEMIRNDWDAFKYLSSIGLIGSVVNINTYKDSRHVKAICQIILMASSLCVKHMDLPIFMSNCLSSLRKLLNVGTDYQAMLIEALNNLLNQDIILVSHLSFIICREKLLNCLVAYFQKVYRANQSEAVKVMSMIYKVSSIREAHIASYFKPCVPYLVGYLETVESSQMMAYVVKTIYNISKDSHMANELQQQGLIPQLLQLYSRLIRSDIKDDFAPVTIDVIRTIDTLITEVNRKNQFILNRGKTIFENSQSQLNNRKDLLDTVATFLRKLE